MVIEQQDSFNWFEGTLKKGEPLIQTGQMNVAIIGIPAQDCDCPASEATAQSCSTEAACMTDCQTACQTDCMEDCSSDCMDSDCMDECSSDCMEANCQDTVQMDCGMESPIEQLMERHMNLHREMMDAMKQDIHRDVHAKICDVLRQHGLGDLLKD